MSDVRPCILIADDRQSTRLVLRRMLAELPADIVEVASGSAALEYARGNEIAVLLLDIEMPGLDGFATIQQLRNIPRHQLTPVILISAASDDAGHRRRGWDLGAADFVSKPPEPVALRQKVRVFLELWQRRMELQQLLGRVQLENEKLFSENEHFRATRSALLFQATHDKLTGLPNRALLEDRLHAAIERARRASRSFALVYIDLDSFKQVNDSHGHSVGDALLGETARRLLRNLRASDTVARIGGDEFVLLLEGLDTDERAVAIASDVLNAISMPLRVPATRGAAEIELCPRASIGVALFPRDAEDAEGLLVLSDLAMYEAKRAGGGLRTYAALSSAE